MLSAAAGSAENYHIWHAAAQPAAGAAPAGISPQQIRTAYGFTKVSFKSATGATVAADGSGETIAIVDAYDDPTIVSDLHQFDVQFGLPDPTFKKIMQPGTTPDPGWAVEITLDVEWSHAIAPKAGIVLVEAADSSNVNLMSAVQTASQIKGVVAVSMSWGGYGDSPGETGYDSYFATKGITYLAATGDDGAPSGYPSYSPNVVAVGGTTLNISGQGNYGSESGWAGSAGGISTMEPQPAYQKGVVTQSFTNRTAPDVAYDADPNTGFAIYDSYLNPFPWGVVGGTSDAAPQWAGLITIADQGRALAGVGPLTGKTQTLPILYSLPGSDFHDITTGSSQGYPVYNAGPGYDLVTGRGTPYANLIIPALFGTPTLGVQFPNIPNNEVWKGQGTLPGAGEVTIDYPQQTDSVVTLVSSNASELAVPATVTIAAGQTTAFFDLTVGNDTLRDGAQTVTITATAQNMNPGSGTITVGDSNIDHFDFSALPKAELAGTAFPVTITADDINDQPITVFNGAVNLTAAGDNNNPETFQATPSTAPGQITFSNGQWTGAITVPGLDNNVVLTASISVPGNPLYAFGSSSSFNVLPVNLDHFQFANIPAQETANVPFNVTITAQDKQNNTVGNFNAPVGLSAVVPNAQAAVGAGNSLWDQPLNTLWEDSRTEVIYTRQDLQLKLGATIRALSLDLSAMPGQSLGNFTIRMKDIPASLSSFGSTSNFDGPGTGWTTVYQADTLVNQLGWNKFAFTTPFTYDGAGNVLVDFSFQNPNFTRAGYCYATQNLDATGTPINRSLWFTTDGLYGDPLNWSSTDPTSPTANVDSMAPNVQLVVDRTVAVIPSLTNNFTSGVWSGQVIVPVGGQVYLRADSGAASTGASNGFNLVLDTTPPTVTSITPAAGSVLGGTSTVFNVTFSEAINPTTILSGTAFQTSGVAASVGLPNEVGNTNTWQVPVTHSVSGSLSLLASPASSPIRDLSGNALVPVAWSYSVDETPPTCIGTSLPGGGTLAGTSPTIDLTFSEPVTGVTTNSLTLAGPAAAAASVTSVTNLGGNTYRFQLANLTTGALTLTLTSAIQDQYGNSFVPLSWSATVVPAPLLTVTVNPLLTTNQAPPLSGLVSDATATVQVTVNGAGYTAANSNGTWTLAAGVISPPLRAGTYTVTATASTAQATVSNTGQLTVQSTVVSQYLYYANSKYDNPAKGGTVDKARATNKQALLPGQTATSANYSDYGFGINGILVDIAGLENASNFNLSDLTLKYGDTSGASTWAAAPAPAKVSVSAAGGDSGSDEVVLTWANNAIPTGNWLQVTVAADQNTGLASPYTFYFGNLIGDVAGDGKVTTADVTAIQKQVGKTAGIANAYDVNRDG
ncbi:MAG: Ig-like domain-containing protein, partial [Thermoguttaceae bacterium]